jgi:hypothetical protein
MRFEIGSLVKVKAPFGDGSTVAVVAAVQFLTESGEIVEHDTGLCQYVLSDGAAYLASLLEPAE